MSPVGILLELIVVLTNWFAAQQFRAAAAWDAVFARIIATAPRPKAASLWS
jgi:hypothetical protein